MPRSSVPCLLFALVAGCAVAAPASAANDDGTSLFVQAGGGEVATRAASIGVAWALPWRSPNYGTLYGVSTRLELFASGWRLPRLGGGHQSLVQVGLVPMVRVRFDNGRSPWFAEGGIGLALLDGELRAPSRTFSTRLNFSDNLGLGRSFGAQGEQELSLHLQHTSNAGLRKPNPGMNLLLLRFSHRF